MPEFAFSDEDRERWAEEAAAVMVALSVSLRKRMAANIGTDLPSDPSEVWDAQWWQDGLDGPVSDGFAAIGANAAATFHEGVGWGPIPDALAATIGVAVAAGMVGVMGGRGDIIAERVMELVNQGQETNTLVTDGASSAEERGGDWLTSELALDTGDGGPLSDKLMADYGTSATNTLHGGAAQAVLDEYGIDVPRTWNCVTGDTLVSAVGVSEVARRWFVGPLARVRTRSGAVLSVTLEHNVLTGRGWQRVDALHEGDYLVNPRVGGRTDDPEVADCPSRIDEVFESALMVSPVERVSGVSVDFDGNFSYADVDVVRPLSDLVGKHVTPLTEHVSDDLFSLPDGVLGALLADGSSRDMAGRTGYPATGDQSLRFHHVAGVNPVTFQCSDDGADGTVKLLCDLACGFPLDVETNDLVNGEFRTLTGQPIGDSLGVSSIADFGSESVPSEVGSLLVQENALFFQPASDSMSTGVDGESDFGRRLARLVALDEIVNIEINEFRGHVYDLSTRSGWFVANGSIIHNCSFLERSRESHMEADGQVAEAGEPFIIDGEEGFFPGDSDNFSVDNCINCACFVTYDVPLGVPIGGAEDTTGDGGDAVSSDDMESFSLQGVTGRTAQWARDAIPRVAGLSRVFADAVPGVADVSGAPVPDPEAAAGVPDYSDSVCVTIEPTAAEKQLLAVDGGLEPGDLHVTLAYLGKLADLDDTARLTISTVLAQVAQVTPPFEGDIAGIGWFGDAAAITVALVDGDGLAALRTAIVDLLVSSGVDVATDHDFQPHCTLAYSQVDAADKVGLPLHFNELRLRFGTEVLAFDLMGPIETAPDQPELVPELAPAPDNPAPTEAQPMTTTETTTLADTPIPDAGAEAAPADLTAVPTDVLVAEMARRAAEQVVAEVAAVSGVEATADQVATATAAVEEEAAEIMDDLTDAAEAALGVVDPDATPDEEPDTETGAPSPSIAASVQRETRVIPSFASFAVTADFEGVTDDDLAAEVARRAAERVITGLGPEADPMLVTEIQSAAEGEAADLWDDLADAISDAAGCDNDMGDGVDSMPDDAGEPVDVPYTVTGDQLAAMITTANRNAPLILRGPKGWMLNGGTLTFTVGGKEDLPIADRDTAWDSAGADQRVQKWASSDGSGDKDKIDFGKLAQGYLWHDGDAPDALASYKLGFTDVVNGELQIIPKGVFAVAAVLNGGRGGVDIPEADQAAIKAKVATIYGKMAAKFKDDMLKAPFSLDTDTGATVVTADTGRPFAVEGNPPAPTGIEYEWEGILCVEGVATDDGRMMGEGSIRWRQLPLPLTFLDKITSAHQLAEKAGTIHAVERRGSAIWGMGTFDDNEAGNKLRAYLTDPKGMGRYGVSADIGGATVVYSTDDGQILDPMEAQDAYYAGENVVELMTEGTLMGATGCVHPAIMEANIWMIQSSADEPANPEDAVLASGPGVAWRTLWNQELRPFGADHAVVASGAAEVPAPPMHLFGLRDDQTPEPFTVEKPLPDGTVPVYGLLAEKGTCHTGSGARCVAVPASNDFRSFYTGKRVLTAEGELLPVGPIIMDTVHPNKLWNASDAQAFYADTGCAVADVRLYRTKWGIVAAGILSPFATAAQVYRLRASDVSPDWRSIRYENGRKEHKVVAVLAVPCSGFVVEGSEALVASGAPEGSVPLQRVVAHFIERDEERERRMAVTDRKLAAVTEYAMTIAANVNRDKAMEALAVFDEDGPIVVSQRRSVSRALRVLGLDADGCACGPVCACQS